MLLVGATAGGQEWAGAQGGRGGRIGSTPSCAPPSGRRPGLGSGVLAGCPSGQIGPRGRRAWPPTLSVVFPHEWSSSVLSMLPPDHEAAECPHPASYLLPPPTKSS